MQRFWASIEGSLAPGVRFYLTVLLTIAAANSLFILVSGTCAHHVLLQHTSCPITYRTSLPALFIGTLLVCAAIMSLN